MTRALLTCLLTAVITAPAAADVTIRQTTTGQGMGLASTMPATTYIKGLKMRTEAVTGDTTRVTILDVENHRMYTFDNRKKEADVWDMRVLAAEMRGSVDTSAMTSSVKPNGQSKQIAGLTATGFDMEIGVPSRVGAGGPAMTVKLVGPIWIVKDAPGTREYIAFYRAAVDRGWIFSDPRAAKASPGQAKAMAQMYRQLTDTGGVPYQTEMEIKMEGEGEVASVMGRMGGLTMSTIVESVETGPVADHLFSPPAGYNLNARQ